MMSQDVDLQADPATVAAGLTAEATALEGRLRQLREAVHVVDTRIASIAESLQTLRGTSTAHGGGERRSGSPGDALPHG
ncbi:hypothetical protein SAMN06272735_8341 [Streptomyces sp. TLI_55]|uniref:hypothetical protein n=1 Tax=Streptomyces sp. TLI_55 TaxID=1938861 RepID=UPI000BD2F44A|nr:hypothetical protein [Streptomyces sp. TLI_55]SNX66473.1 hypothetical protein SAMN06272735_8341 [Streptomyces sp. TLI_55]